MSTIPYKFQLEDVRRLHQMGGRAILAWDMGLGKTLAALLYAQRHPEQRPIVVVCPAGLKLQWRKEAKRHIGMHADILEGLNPSKMLTPRDPKLVIVNYDILSQSKHGSGWTEWLKELKPQLVILDECHYLTSMTSKRTKSVRELCKGVKQVIALSGTPLVNRPIELFPVLNILRPDLFRNWFSFGHRWCGAEKDMFGKWTFKGATKLDEFHKLLEDNVMIRRRKEDVLDQLPRKRRHIVLVELSKEGRKEYKEAHKNFVGWLRNTWHNRDDPNVKMKSLNQGTMLKSMVGKYKLQAVKDWIDNFLQSEEEKLIVFGVHREFVRSLHENWPKESVLIYGGTPTKDRRMAEDKFLKTEKTKLFFGNIRAAGVGWNAKGVKHVAFGECDWTPGMHQQAGDRTHGIGRGVEGQSSEEWWLIAKDTIEERLVKLLQKKSRVLDSVLDGKQSNDFDVFTQLTESLLRENGNGKV